MALVADAAKAKEPPTSRRLRRILFQPRPCLAVPCLARPCPAKPCQANGARAVPLAGDQSALGYAPYSTAPRMLQSTARAVKRRRTSGAGGFRPLFFLFGAARALLSGGRGRRFKSLTPTTLSLTIRHLFADLVVAAGGEKMRNVARTGDTRWHVFDTRFSAPLSCFPKLRRKRP
jgi:hypothetical protein